jgi:uncharacterized protein
MGAFPAIYPALGDARQLDIDLSSQRVTDLHCFSFPRTSLLTRSSLARLFMGGGPTVMGMKPELRQGDLASSVAYRRMIHELARLLKVRGTEAEVLRKRNERARDFPGYAKLLFEDAGIEELFIDNGLEPVRFEEFKRYAPARLKRVFRIEPLLKRLLVASKTFEDLFDSFDQAIRSAVNKEGFVGFKSVIAYRTGLEVEETGEPEARESFGRYLDGAEPMEWFGPRVKPLRDFLLRHVAERSKGLNAFLQVHTGVGDTDVVATKCDPLFLTNFLKLEAVRRIPVVLIHGGFPYTGGAAWLANVFPNVYFELSTPLPPTFQPALSKGRFREVIETVPISRIVYGSDAIETPENHWLSAILAKRAMGRVLGDLAEQGVVDEDQARKDGARIFGSNALGLLR